ncbi:MAG: hypothetical protein KDA61_22785, partial [Planctomycetales bacterium]|nr:hypothetical protein [Planctomycetales bacterium]
VWSDELWDVHLGPGSEALCLESIDESTGLYAGRPQDHPAILALLERTSGKRLALDFASRVDEPGYQAADRLLLRQGSRLLAQVNVMHRVAWLGGNRAPIANFVDCAAAPEATDRNLIKTMWDVAEDQAMREGAIIGFAYACDASTLAGRGWRPLPQQGYTRIAARTALARLEDQRTRREARYGEAARRPLQVTACRCFHADALRRIYERRFSPVSGALYRSDEHWQWLLSRGAHDQVLLAHKAPQSPSGEVGEVALDDIVGYAVVKDSCVVEMAVEEQHRASRGLLLAEVCRNAIEHGRRHIELHAPADDPLHDLLITAGGTWRLSDSPHACRWLLKLLAPEKWVERQFEAWQQRTRDAGLARPLEFHLLADGMSQRFQLTRRCSRLLRGRDNPSSWVAGGVADLHAALLGADPTVPLRFSDDEVAHIFGQVAPRQTFWRSPWETLRLN